MINNQIFVDDHSNLKKKRKRLLLKTNSFASEPKFNTEFTFTIKVLSLTSLCITNRIKTQWIYSPPIYISVCNARNRTQHSPPQPFYLYRALAASQSWDVCVCVHREKENTRFQILGIDIDDLYWSTDCSAIVLSATYNWKRK